MPFEAKLFKYPRIVGKIAGISIDLSGSKPAQFLGAEGKTIRDALTHPSPYLDPNTGEYEKAARILYLTHLDVEPLYAAAVDYAAEVESSLYKDANKTAPWLFTKDNKLLSAAMEKTTLKESTILIFP